MTRRMDHDSKHDRGGSDMKTGITEQVIGVMNRPFNAPPALAGYHNFLRSNRFLYCISAGAGG